LLFLPPEAHEMLDEIRKWKNAKDWYQQRNIPWQRGWLLYGPPGTGKSSLVRAIGQDLDMPIMAFDLATMSNDDFLKSWDETLSRTPCIALIEDIDGVFNGREHVAKSTVNQQVSFDCLLNCISGVKRADGVFLIITTNNPEKLDLALAGPDGGMPSRPGRIDRVLALKSLDEIARRDIAKILADMQ
jgi:SpoVK/Ycf46/Vps4 family AAA+-type ATPase